MMSGSRGSVPAGAGTFGVRGALGSEEWRQHQPEGSRSGCRDAYAEQGELRRCSRHGML